MQSTLTDSETNSSGRNFPFALAAGIFCAYFFISLCSTIWDRDEARFARATAEMVSTGNYLYPTFNGKLRPDKPILIYWLMSVPVRLFGQTEWAYRLCSVCGTTLACVFTCSIGRSLFNRRTGLWAMALLAANPLVFYTGAVATSDAVLLAFMTGAFAVFADALKNGLRARHLLALCIVFTGGMLTKGPVALLPLVPFIIALLWLRRAGERPALMILKITGCAVAAGLLFLAWFYPANRATHGDLYDQMFVHHVIERIQKPLENHGGYSLFYLNFYWIVIAAGFFPWTLYLPGALVRLSAKRAEMDTEARRQKVFLLAWIVTFLVVMVAISTKLPHYILPIWPALALCVGAYLDGAASKNEPAQSPLWNVAGGVLFLAAALAVAAAIGFGPEYLANFARKPDPLWKAYADASAGVRSVFGALILLVALPVVFRHRAAHFAANARALLGAALLFFIGAGVFLLPGFERIKISKNLADQIRKNTADDMPVTVCGYNEASLIFYLNRNVEDIVADKSDGKTESKPAPRLLPQAAAKVVEQAVSDWAARSGTGVLIIPKQMYERLRSDVRIAELQTVGEVNGFNYSKGHWVDVLALRRPH